MAERAGAAAAAGDAPAVGGRTRRDRPLGPAREMAGRLWRDGATRWAVQEALRSTWGLGRQQAEVVVAEQAAVERITRAGLDPALVADEVDQLLRRLDDPAAGR